MSKLSLAQNHNDSQSSFDNIRRINDQGNEYWDARELMDILGYPRWSDFHKTIKRGMTAYTNQHSSNALPEHFSGDRLNNNKKGRDPKTYKLSRLACYLIAMNGDPKKKEIAAAQNYFATKTYERESLEAVTTAQGFLQIAQLMVEQEKRTKLLEAKLELESQRNDKLAEMVNQHDAELERIHKPCGNYFTIVGYANLKGLRNISYKEANLLGRKASALCCERGLKKEMTTDPRFGLVGCYPEEILKEIL